MTSMVFDAIKIKNGTTTPDLEDNRCSIEDEDGTGTHLPIANLLVREEPVAVRRNKKKVTGIFTRGVSKRKSTTKLVTMNKQMSGYVESISVECQTEFISD